MHVHANIPQPQPVVDGGDNHRQHRCHRGGYDHGKDTLPIAMTTPLLSDKKGQHWELQPSCCPERHAYGPYDRMLPDLAAFHCTGNDPWCEGDGRVDDQEGPELPIAFITTADHRYLREQGKDGKHWIQKASPNRHCRNDRGILLPECSGLQCLHRSGRYGLHTPDDTSRQRCSDSVAVVRDTRDLSRTIGSTALFSAELRRSHKYSRNQYVSVVAY